jgi:hypothetical protein
MTADNAAKLHLLLKKIESLDFAARFLATSSLPIVLVALATSPELQALRSNFADKHAQDVISRYVEQLLIHARECPQETLANQDIPVLALLFHLERSGYENIKELLDQTQDIQQLFWARAFSTHILTHYPFQPKHRIS